MPIKVSVIVPVRGTGSVIEGDIDSMPEQTLPADEHEVAHVDDGSTDDTPGRLEKRSVEGLADVRPRMKCLFRSVLGRG